MYPCGARVSLSCWRLCAPNDSFPRVERRRPDIGKARTDVSHGNLATPHDFRMAIFVGDCQEISRVLNSSKLCPGLERQMRSAAPLPLRSDSGVTSHSVGRRQQMSNSFVKTDQFCGQWAAQVTQTPLYLELVSPGRCRDCALSIPPKLFPRATVWLRALKGSGPLATQRRNRCRRHIVARANWLWRERPSIQSS